MISLQSFVPDSQPHSLDPRVYGFPPTGEHSHVTEETSDRTQCDTFAPVSLGCSIATDVTKPRGSDVFPQHNRTFSSKEKEHNQVAGSPCHSPEIPLLGLEENMTRPPAKASSTFPQSASADGLASSFSVDIPTSPLAAKSALTGEPLSRSLLTLSVH